MTEDRDFKAIVRQRAAKTGESYQAARRQLDPSTFVARVDALFRLPVGRVILGCTVEDGEMVRAPNYAAGTPVWFLGIPAHGIGRPWWRS